MAKYIKSNMISAVNWTVSPKFKCLGPHLHCDCTWRQALYEIIKVNWGHRREKSFSFFFSLSLSPPTLMHRHQGQATWGHSHQSALIKLRSWMSEHTPLFWFTKPSPTYNSVSHLHALVKTSFPSSLAIQFTHIVQEDILEFPIPAKLTEFTVVYISSRSSVLQVALCYGSSKHWWLWTPLSSSNRCLINMSLKCHLG